MSTTNNGKKTTLELNETDENDFQVLKFLINKQTLTNILTTSYNFVVAAKASGVLPPLSAFSKFIFSERKKVTPFLSVSHSEAAWTMKCSGLYKPRIQC